MEHKEALSAQTLESLAEKVMQLNIHTLMIELRYLQVALQQLTLQAEAEGSLSTDGTYCFYRPRTVLQRYKKEPAASVRDYLHMVLHCIFRHMYLSEPVEVNCWDLACDMTVELMINGLGLRSTAARRQKEQKHVLEELQKYVKHPTAEKVYHWLLAKKWSPGEIEQMNSLFYADDHSLWHIDSSVSEVSSTNPQEKEEREKTPQSPDQQSDLQQSPVEDIQKEKREVHTVMETIWADIARQVEMELLSFDREHSGRINALMQNLLEINREKYDYTAFLKKFAVRSEVVQIDPDEFDYIFYAYGLKLYHNIPLIEPLEYKEIRRIRSFVVAIDTSGSTSGALVQRFIQKTYNILQSTESFFSQVELYIIQCDDEVREAVCISSLDEFESYLKTMQIRGHGATDFRPVFAYVDQLRQQGLLKDLKGLIYFTDGYGTFPLNKPDYETAFVFLDDEYARPQVPPWAIRLVLRTEEI